MLYVETCVQLPDLDSSPFAALISASFPIAQKHALALLLVCSSSRSQKPPWTACSVPPVLWPSPLLHAASVIKSQCIGNWTALTFFILFLGKIVDQCVEERGLTRSAIDSTPTVALHLQPLRVSAKRVSLADNLVLFVSIPPMFLTEFMHLSLVTGTLFMNISPHGIMSLSPLR